MDRAIESSAYAGLAIAGKEAINLMRGKQDLSGLGENISKAAIVTSSSTLIVAYLFN